MQEYDLDTLPPRKLYDFCLWVARKTEEYFKDPQVQKEYEIWLKEKREKEKRENEAKALENANQ